jgi:hypothetical protein
LIDPIFVFVGPVCLFAEGRRREATPEVLAMQTGHFEITDPHERGKQFAYALRHDTPFADVIDRAISVSAAKRRRRQSPQSLTS